MGNLFSLYSGDFFPDPFGDRPKADEDTWLEIEKVPYDDSSWKATNKKRSKKNASKYAGKQTR